MSKTTEEKLEFIKRRAIGESFDKIATSLHVSKATCSRWERELSAQITEAKQQELTELYSAYHLTKAERIKSLGGILQRIDQALEEVDLTSVPPEKLLKLRLEYTEQLKSEYIGTDTPLTISGKVSPEEALQALSGLYNRIRSGEVTEGQATIEGKALTTLLQAYSASRGELNTDTLAAMLQELDYSAITDS